MTLQRKFSRSSWCVKGIMAQPKQPFTFFIKVFAIMCLAGSVAKYSHAMEMSKNALQNTSPVQLRVRAIARLPASNLEKALLAALELARGLKAIHRKDDTYLIHCYQVLRQMCSFEYLDKYDLLLAANELNAFLYVLKKDNGLRLFCMASEFDSFRERIEKLLLASANTALIVCRKKQADQTKSNPGLIAQIKLIDDEIKFLIAEARDIVGRYSKVLTDNVKQKYLPLEDFLVKRREYQEFKKSIEEAPKSEQKKPAVVSYAAATSNQADIQKAQQEKLRTLLEVAKLADSRSDSARLALCRSLGELNSKVFLLHNHAICKPMDLGRLDDLLVIRSFFYLLAGANDSPLRLLVDGALKKIPYQAKLRMILQRYICEAHDVPEVAQAAKGRIWEIAVALFLKDKDILKDLGRDVSQAGKKFAREFDVSFGNPEILADCKAIADWNYWYPKDELPNSETKNKKVRQINDQAKIAKSLDKACVIISKYPIPADHKNWLRSKGVCFVSPEDHILSINLPDEAPVSISFEDLYKPKYCFEF